MVPACADRTRGGSWFALLSPFLRLSLWLRGFRLVSARESSFIKSCWGVVSWLRGGCHVVWCGLFSFSYSNFVLFLAFVCPSYIHFDLIFFVKLPMSVHHCAWSHLGLVGMNFIPFSSSIVSSLVNGESVKLYTELTGGADIVCC